MRVNSERRDALSDPHSAMDSALSWERSRQKSQIIIYFTSATGLFLTTIEHESIAVCDPQIEHPFSLIL